MNKLIISGNLCKDMELRYTTSGKEVLQNCVAVRRDFKGPSGENETDFINIVCWGNQATYLNQYAKKGDRVEICGRLQKRTYTAQDGLNRDIYECIVESISAFSKEPKPQETMQRGAATATTSSGIGAEPNNNYYFNEEDMPF